MHGRHLTLEEREILAQERAAGRSHAAIARRLGCNRSTVWRELKRNGGAFGMYLPSRAQASADRRRRRSKQPWKLEGTDLGRRVQEGLRQCWAPEQIAGPRAMGREVQRRARRRARPRQLRRPVERG